MLSHDTRLRCDLVDLYYTLYGTRRPVCLPIPELAGILRPPRHSSGPSESKRIKSIPPARAPHVTDIKRTNSPVPVKQEVVNDVVVVEENMNVVDIEVVVGDEDKKPKIKVRLMANIAKEIIFIDHFIM